MGSGLQLGKGLQTATANHPNYVSHLLASFQRFISGMAPEELREESQN